MIAFIIGYLQQHYFDMLKIWKVISSFIYFYCFLDYNLLNVGKISEKESSFLFLKNRSL